MHGWGTLEVQAGKERYTSEYSSEVNHRWKTEYYYLEEIGRITWTSKLQKVKTATSRLCLISPYKCWYIYEQKNVHDTMPRLEKLSLLLITKCTVNSFHVSYNSPPWQNSTLRYFFTCNIEISTGNMLPVPVYVQEDIFILRLEALNLEKLYNGDCYQNLISCAQHYQTQLVVTLLCTSISTNTSIMLSAV